jgi:hypothetical protein
MTDQNGFFYGISNFEKRKKFDKLTKDDYFIPKESEYQTEEVEDIDPLNYIQYRFTQKTFDIQKHLQARRSIYFDEFNRNLVKNNDKNKKFQKALQYLSKGTQPGWTHDKLDKAQALLELHGFNFETGKATGGRRVCIDTLRRMRDANILIDGIALKLITWPARTSPSWQKVMKTWNIKICDDGTNSLEYGMWLREGLRKVLVEEVAPKYCKETKEQMDTLIQDQQKDLTKKEQIIKELKNENEKLKKELVKKEDTIKELKETKPTPPTSRDGDSEDQAEGNEIKKLRQKIKQLESDGKTLSASYDRIIEGKSTKIAELENDIAEIRNQLSDKEIEITKLLNGLDEKKSKIEQKEEDLNKQAADFKTRLKEEEDEMTKLKSRHEADMNDLRLKLHEQQQSAPSQMENKEENESDAVEESSNVDMDDENNTEDIFLENHVDKSFEELKQKCAALTDAITTTMENQIPTPSIDEQKIETAENRLRNMLEISEKLDGVLIEFQKTNSTYRQNLSKIDEDMKTLQQTNAQISSMTAAERENLQEKLKNLLENEPHIQEMTEDSKKNKDAMDKAGKMFEFIDVHLTMEKLTEYVEENAHDIETAEKNFLKFEGNLPSFVETMLCFLNPETHLEKYSLILAFSILAKIYMKKSNSSENNMEVEKILSMLWIVKKMEAEFKDLSMTKFAKLATEWKKELSNAMLKNIQEMDINDVMQKIERLDASNNDEDQDNEKKELCRKLKDAMQQNKDMSQTIAVLKEKLSKEDQNLIDENEKLVKQQRDQIKMVLDEEAYLTQLHEVEKMKLILRDVIHSMSKSLNAMKNKAKDEAYRRATLLETNKRQMNMSRLSGERTQKLRAEKELYTEEKAFWSGALESIKSVIKVFMENRKKMLNAINPHNDPIILQSKHNAKKRKGEEDARKTKKIKLHEEKNESKKRKCFDEDEENSSNQAAKKQKTES